MKLQRFIQIAEGNNVTFINVDHIIRVEYEKSQGQLQIFHAWQGESRMEMVVGDQAKTIFGQLGRLSESGKDVDVQGIVEAIYNAGSAVRG